MKKIILILLIIILTQALPVSARLGGSGAFFLGNGSGSRSSALGGAYCALGNDIDAIFINPAGIAAIDRNALSFGYFTSYFASMNFQTAAASFNAGMLGNFGISYIGLQSGDIEITTIEEPNGTGNYFDANSFAIGFSFARNLTNKFATGATFKIIQEGIDQVSASTWAIDLGGTYKTDFRNLTFGFSIQNFGPDMTLDGDALDFHSRPSDPDAATDLYEGMDEDAPAGFNTEGYPIPLIFQIGTAIDVFETDLFKMVASFDMINPSDQPETFGIGTEVLYQNLLAMRIGYTDRNNRNLTAGMGLNVDMSGSKVMFNYTFQNHEYLDPLHTVTVNFMF